MAVGIAGILMVSQSFLLRMQTLFVQQSLNSDLTCSHYRACYKSHPVTLKKGLLVFSVKCRSYLLITNIL